MDHRDPGTPEQPRPETPAALALTDITMAFGANSVLKGVTMRLTPGRVTALLGANGAGKSTLIKILSGVYQGYGGTVEVGGEPIHISSPIDAARHGVQTVHQRIDDSIVPGLSVAENLTFEEIVQGDIPAVRSLKAILPRARQIAATLDLGWSDEVLRKDVFDLGIADAQLLLLARALIRRPKVLVLDEPTSTLSQAEADRLFDVVRRLREEGVAILYVSHHLDEIRTMADDLVVLRDGRIHDEQAAPFDMSRAIRSMLGESVAVAADELVERRGERVAIHLEGVQLLKRSRPFDLDLRYGEVTGIVGLIGAGKSELARGIFGVDRFRAGTMTFDGQPFAPRRSGHAVRKGIYLVPEDRAAEAMLPGWAIAATATLPFLGRFCRGSVIDLGRERRRGVSTIEDFGVVATGPDQPLDALSGGNQQKVVVGRWFAESPKVMLLDEPFRGVDIGARRDISRQARELAGEGACVVVLSSDVDEIREVADRIVVLVDGHPRFDAYTTQTDGDAIVASMSEVA
ncbi:sugar ABC transporter ATP-binding protein [Mobilicoccus massiliensis]|uniref:sugar ABC transporter ATP-binding protein n=1 Tax=Mobilicoccus massiliensis TaxID=1522310 RepID=UPI000694D475|nr:sugar ABC transporter ATP-binding protein [Mobilicoccus massiliensis]